MNGSRNFLCSYILDIINNKPLQSVNVDKLLNDLRTTLKHEGIVVQHLKDEVEGSIQNCMSLGILKLSNDQICLPFRLKNSDTIKKGSRARDKNKPTEIKLQPGLGLSRKSINPQRKNVLKRKRTKYPDPFKSKTKKLTKKRIRRRLKAVPMKS